MENEVTRQVHIGRKPIGTHVKRELVAEDRTALYRISVSKAEVDRASLRSVLRFLSILRMSVCVGSLVLPLDCCSSSTSGTHAKFLFFLTGHYHP